MACHSSTHSEAAWDPHGRGALGFWGSVPHTLSSWSLGPTWEGEMCRRTCRPEPGRAGTMAAVGWDWQIQVTCSGRTLSN